MRYRIGQEPDINQSQPVGEDGLTIFTAVFSLITGIGFVVAGVKGRQRWLAFWGGLMSLVSVAYLGFIVFR